MQKRNILVTGGAGFIGSHLADKLLEAGNDVVILDNESTGLKENVPGAATYFKGDVRNPADVKMAFDTQIDAVFHVAGQASNIRSFDDPSDDLATNVSGTLNILEACLQYQVPRLLFASSMTAYGHPEAVPVAENQAARPISYYGITKYAAERYALATAERVDLPFKFSVTAFRMFNVYGERQRLDNPYQGALGFLVGNVLRDEPITIHSDGKQTRDFVHIDDVVEAWTSALDNPATHGKVFNLGAGEATSINYLIDTILTIRGYTRDNYPIQHTACRPGDQRYMQADISLCEEVFAWKPRISLKDGLIRTIEWAESELAKEAIVPMQ